MPHLLALGLARAHICIIDSCIRNCVFLKLTVTVEGAPVDFVDQDNLLRNSDCTFLFCQYRQYASRACKTNSRTTKRMKMIKPCPAMNTVMIYATKMSCSMKNRMLKIHAIPITTTRDRVALIQYLCCSCTLDGKLTWHCYVYRYVTYRTSASFVLSGSLFWWRRMVITDMMRNPMFT